jgi:hypothetical protein
MLTKFLTICYNIYMASFSQIRGNKNVRLIVIIILIIIAAYLLYSVW